jgi:APA family basic amino acid/polyamine antiporter
LYVIYVLANLMYLAVVPLQDIATAPADRVGVVASQYILVDRNFDYRR